MARDQQLPIWRAAMDLALGLEQAAACFPRVHGDALGAELRRSAQQILGGVMRCARAREQREGELERLILLIEQTKVQLTLARELKVFASFQHFARAAGSRQVDAFFSRTRLRRWQVQVGRRYWLMAPGSGRPLALLTPARARGWAAAARAAGTPFGVLVQCGWQRDGRRERQLAAVFQPVTATNASHPFALSTPSAGVN